MGKRSESLVNRIREGTSEVIKFVQACSDKDWETRVENDDRTVGVLCHHVASAYLVELNVLNALKEGNGLAGVTWDMVNQGNAQHAKEHPNPTKTDTIELLKENSEIIAAVVDELSDEQLDAVGPISINHNAPLSVQFFIEEHPIAHPYYHLDSIKAAIAQ